MKKYTLECIVFICGSAVMILEMAGSRILAPYLGTSTFVWTGLIGIILASLSIGYWYGGQVADKNPNYKVFSTIILTSGISIGIITYLKSWVLFNIQSSVSDIRIGALIATLALFSIPSVLLGMVSPYAAKLKINSLNTSGSTVGNLYAISTIGSIFGTFVTGFFLIPYIGTTKILLLLCVILIITSFAANIKNINVVNILLIIFFSSSVLFVNQLDNPFKYKNFVSLDSEYNSIWIYDSTYNNKSIKQLQLNNEFSSGMSLDNDDLAFEYTKFYDLAEHFKPNFQNVLMIGGAAYSYPKYFINKYPNSFIDVVEIDPMLTSIAKQHFNLKPSNNLKSIHQDARIFLNTSNKIYDVILGDAFKSNSIPNHLTTKECVQKMYNLLSNDGIVILNIISSIEGEKGKFLRAEYHTYKSIFPQVYLFAVNNPNDGSKLQNLILVALKSNIQPNFTSTDNQLNNYLKHTWTKPIPFDVPILTDNFSPVDYYMSKTF